MTAVVSIVTAVVINFLSILLVAKAGDGIIAAVGVLAVMWCVKITVSPFVKKHPTKRLTSLKKGERLLTVFLVSLVASTAWLVFLILANDTVFISASRLTTGKLIISCLLVFLFELVIFWGGMVRCFIVSTQLGIKWRVIAVVFSWIVPVNIIVLAKMISLSKNECLVESEKIELDNARAESEICKTKYPVLLVHGVFFRDFRYFNYWGRIPTVLKRNGATFFYGNQQSAASVEKSGEELAKRIQQIIKETGCEKVNIIAHSKGGLDSRYAISRLGMDKYVASLTTVCTPHRGCKFAQWLLTKVSDSFYKAVADKYNRALKLVGDESPDFCAAVNSLTESACESFNVNCPDKDGVYYQSVGSVSEKAAAGRFPLNLSYRFVKLFDGENDGLVSLESMKWGEHFERLIPKGKRGITHGDVIDLNRENIEGFDVREYYVGLLSQLKAKGF